MDPDQALADLRALVKTMAESLHGEDKGLDFGDVGEDMEEFVEKFNALDEWLSNGGFLPRDWKQHG